MPGTTLNTGSIAQLVRDALDGIPSSVDSGTNVQDWVELAKIGLQNYFNESISNAPVPEKYQNLLFHLGCAYTLGKMTGAGITFNASLGEFSVTKMGEDKNTSQANFHIQQVNAEMVALAARYRYGRTW